MNDDIASGNAENKVKEETEKIAKELHVTLLGQGLPLPVNLISAFMLIGGLSIIGSSFADIVDPVSKSLFLYFLRFSTGIAAIAISYGLIKRERWAIWIYGFIIFAGLFINPVLTLLPLAILIYLYLNRQLFRPSVLDRISSDTYNIVKQTFFTKN
ncbi:MAG: hypothetical protein Q8Q37_01660 [bacterium]|nr:hypothetical protein [bacterium]